VKTRLGRKVKIYIKQDIEKQKAESMEAVERFIYKRKRLDDYE